MSGRLRARRWQLTLLLFGCLTITPVSAQGRADLARMAALERQDLGVPPTGQLRGDSMHAPTPASIPGGQVITTQGLVALIEGRQAPFILVDVLGGAQVLPQAIPAVWLAQPGSFDDAVQRRAKQSLDQVTRGRRDIALIFYCQSRECWMSYNAALRAIRAGYSNVLWYRGGLEAWQAAGLPTQPAAQTQAQSQPVPGGSAGTQAGAPAPRPGSAGVGSAFTPVTPVAPNAQAGTHAPAAGELRISQGRYFSFAMPPGWRVGEEGPFAVTLVAPDNRALTVMVGNSGLPLNHSPVAYAQQRLRALGAHSAQMSPGRQAKPAAGFNQAVEFDVSFTGNAGPTRGVLKISMAPSYDSMVMAMTAALSAVEQWPNYASWLPLVADQVAATNGAAFGRRGIMAQNLRNSIAFGAAAREYREWSQRNWQGVVDARNDSADRRNFAARENLGGVQTFSSPYGITPAVELPMTYQYYWQDRQGRFVGTNDPSADPNVGSTGEWRRMQRMQR